MKYTIPEVGEMEINTIVLDLNGTLSVRGKIPCDMREKITDLKKIGIEIILFTGDHRDTAQALCDGLGIQFFRAKTSAEKEALFLEQDIEKTAAIGNARIDIGTFKHAQIAIATLQAEGIHTDILQHVDVIVPSISDALDLFLDKSSLESTMRK